MLLLISGYFSAPYSEIRSKIRKFVSNYENAFRISKRNYELQSEFANLIRREVQRFIMSELESELECFLKAFENKLSESSINLIRDTLKTNGFNSRLQLKLISEKEVELMFPDYEALTLGGRRLLPYQLQVLKEESPLQKTVKRPFHSAEDSDVSNEKQVS